MTDRTQHVIDAIDGALDDWTVSDDAMRWSPEPGTVDDAGAPYTEDDDWALPFGLEHRRPVDHLSFAERVRADEARSIHRMMAGSIWFRPAQGDEWTDISHLVDDVRPMQWQAAALADVYGVAIRQAAEAMARLFALSEDQAERWAAVIAELDLPEPDEPTVEDPRARALQLRQSRGTGPDRQVTRQKRPRRLP